MNHTSLARVLALVADEVTRTSEHHDEFNSAHEGYAVLAEEVDELWDEIKKRPETRSNAALRKEAIQVAAMAVRLILDCCEEPES